MTFTEKVRADQRMADARRLTQQPDLVYTRAGVLDMTRRIRSTPRPEPERIVLWLDR